MLLLHNEVNNYLVCTKVLTGENILQTKPAKEKKLQFVIIISINQNYYKILERDWLSVA